MLFKYIKYFILFFALFYSENFEVFGMSFSQLWKIPLIVFLIFDLIINLNLKRPTFQKISFWYAFKMLFNTNVFYRPFSNITEVSRFLTLPLLFGYFRNKSSISLDQWLLFIAQFVILSSIPFHLGLLDSLGKEVSLAGFGYDMYGHTGIFQGAHSASVTYTLSVIVLINSLVNTIHKKAHFYNNKVYNVFLICIGVYSIYLGYVRTGYLMFVVALLVLFLSKFKFTFKQIAVSLISLSIISFLLFTLIQNNDAFKARILDQRVHGDVSVGSGRFIFWSNAYERWKNGNTTEILFGIGMDNFKEYQEDKIGLRIISHSQFFDSLVQNGFIGLSLYLFMLVSLYKYIRKRKQHNGYHLALSLYVAYLMFALVQGSAMFLIDLFIALSLSNISINGNPSLDKYKKQKYI